MFCDVRRGYAAAEVPLWNLRAVTSSMYLLPCFRPKALKLSKDDEIPGNVVTFMLMTVGPWDGSRKGLE